MYAYWILQELDSVSCIITSSFSGSKIWYYVGARSYSTELHYLLTMYSIKFYININ